MQTAALGFAGVTVGLAVVAARITAWHARRRAEKYVGTSAGGPHILYFTTEQCSACRLLQEPALAQVEATVRKVDAIAEAELARRYSILTVPSTVVIGADGRASSVNYGFASAAKLRRQLSSAGS
ncbi:MAG: thioredoxin family protein [Candidatus Dormibacteraeota bacterium]|nr:thioredoxin family protein [Candidatus Dormibacteraeota bacterium]